MKLTKKEAAKTVTKTTAKKAASTRKLNARGKSTSAKRAAVSKAFAHWAKASSAYAGPGIVTPIRGGIIVAALVVAGFAKLNKGDSISKAGKGNVKLLAELVGKGPYPGHKKAERFDADGLTKGGLDWFNARIVSQSPTYRTNRETVAKLVTAMQKGGKVDSLNFNREVAG